MRTIHYQNHCLNIQNTKKVFILQINTLGVKFTNKIFNFLDSEFSEKSAEDWIFVIDKGADFELIFEQEGTIGKHCIKLTYNPHLLQP